MDKIVEKTLKNSGMISVEKMVNDFNDSTFRHNSIPDELVSGWPSVKKMGRELCLNIPYYLKKAQKGKTLLYPIHCSVTFPISNPEKIMDYTIYTFSKDWQDIDFSKPACIFDTQELYENSHADEYRILTNKLYIYFDKMIKAMLMSRPFTEQEEMKRVFKKLVEPGMLEMYKRVNSVFYSCFAE